MTATSISVSTRGGDPTRVGKVKDQIDKLVNLHFPMTLGQEPDVVNIVNALVRKESSHNANAIGPAVSIRPGTGGANYWFSSAVTALREQGTSTQKDNLAYGIVGLGLMQVMGWNLVLGGSKSGKCEVERLRPDLAGIICVAPGESLQDKILGPENLSNAILAGLVILEGKHKAVYRDGLVYRVKGDSYGRQFPSKIAGAIAAYLGLGKSDRLGTTPEQYAAEIVGGSVYQSANYSPSAVRDSVTKTASIWVAQTNGSDQSTICTPGCC